MYWRLTGHEIKEKIRTKEISCREVVDDAFARIEMVEPKVEAFLHTDRDAARRQADAVDAKIKKGESLWLLGGMPVAVKDIMHLGGQPTSCASKILEGFVAPYAAYCVERVIAEDGVVVGKTNMDEFAMGSSTETSRYKQTKNPWALDRIPGGSSGGSAAAVAAGCAFAALGTDTGGSIRQPASMCGVVGIKPTYGRVSRYGVVAFASSLDQVGPFGRDVEDAALMLQTVAGRDPRDSTSSGAAVPDYRTCLNRPVAGMRLGVPKEYFIGGLDGDVEHALKAAIDVYKGLGADVVEISLPHTEYAVAVYYVIATAEASSNLARYDGVHYGHRTRDIADLVSLYANTRAEGFGDEVKRRIMLGTYVLSAGYYDAYYLKAQKVRALIKRDFDEAFEKVDCIITPTAPTPAFRLGEKTDDPLAMYLSDIFTISANLAGICGISVPCGFSNEGLPIGMQLLGGVLAEETVIRAAHAFEQATDFVKMPEL